jgi:hypothetical protein
LRSKGEIHTKAGKSQKGERHRLLGFEVFVGRWRIGENSTFLTSFNARSEFMGFGKAAARIDRDPAEGNTTRETGNYYEEHRSMRGQARVRA